MSEPFRQLEPPPGGLQGLRERVAEHEYHVLIRRRAMLAMAAMCCLMFGGGLWARWGQAGQPEQGQEVYERWTRSHPALSLARSKTWSPSVKAAQRSQTTIEQVAQRGHITYYRVGQVGRSVQESSP